jgi:hypothetical protein
MANTTRLSDLPMGSTDYQGLATASDNGVPLANTIIAGGNNYMPLNIHPNPYGNSVPSVDSMPFPTSQMRPGQSVQLQQQQHQPQQQQTHFANSTPLDALSRPDQGTGQGQEPSGSTSILPEMLPSEIQRLPSRDIPLDTTRHSQDEAVQANYIPPPPRKRVKDYIQEYDATESDKIQQHEREKQNQEWYETMFRTYQHPLLIALLYFIFQMQFISQAMFTYLGLTNLTGHGETRLGLTNNLTGHGETRLGKWSWLYQPDGQLSAYGIAVKSALFTAVYVGLTAVLTMA